jgi:hypothetical protein
MPREGVHAGTAQPTGGAKIVLVEGSSAVGAADLRTNSYRSIELNYGMVDIFRWERFGKWG